MHTWYTKLKGYTPKIAYHTYLRQDNSSIAKVLMHLPESVRPSKEGIHLPVGDDADSSLPLEFHAIQQGCNEEAMSATHVLVRSLC